MPRDKPFNQWLIQRSRKIHETDQKEAGAWIEFARMVIVVRQLHERMMFAHGDSFRVGHHVLHKLPGGISNEGQSGFHFGIVWKIPRILQIQRRAGIVDMVIALLCLLESGRYFLHIVQEETRCIDQRALSFLRRHLKSPQCRLSKRFRNRARLIRTSVHSSKRVICLY